MNEEKKEIRNRLVQGRFRMSLHGQERAIERLITQSDIIHCAVTASRILFQPHKETWKVIGRGLDNDKLTIICKLHNDLLIVTVY